MSRGLEVSAWLGRAFSLVARDARTRRLRQTALAATGLAFACVALLVGDYARAGLRAPAEARRVATLEEQAKREPRVATALHEERARQTAASRARETRGRIAAWLLLASAGVFVACGQRVLALQAPPSPSFEEVTAVRLGLPTDGRDPLAGLVSPDRPPAAPGDLDLGFVDQLVDRLGRSREAAIPILQSIQDHYRYLPDLALERVCELTEITPAQIAGTSSFYAQFRRTPAGQHVARVCHGTACHVAGAEQITGELRRHLGVPSGADTDPEGRVTLDVVACIGCCSLAPVMMVGEHTVGRLTPASARQWLDSLAES